MRKYFNRIKYWFLVRRYHIDGIRLESNRDGGVDVCVEANSGLVRIAEIKHLEGVSECVTDYGIMKCIDRAT